MILGGCLLHLSYAIGSLCQCDCLLVETGTPLAFLTAVESNEQLRPGALNPLAVILSGIVLDTHQILHSLLILGESMTNLWRI